MSCTLSLRWAAVSETWTVILLISVVNTATSEGDNSTQFLVHKCQQFSTAFHENDSRSLTVFPHYLLAPHAHSILVSDLKFRLTEYNADTETACSSKKAFVELVTESVQEANGSVSVDLGGNLTLHAQLRVDDEYYEPDEYCVREVTQETITVEICQNQHDCSTGTDNGEGTVTTGKVLCIPKCCSIGKSLAFTDDGPGCVSSGPILWSPTLYSDSDPRTKISDAHASPAPRKHFVLKSPNCTEHNMWPLTALKFDGEVIQEKQIWRLLSDGNIAHLSSSRVWTTLKDVEYCIDGMIPDFQASTNFSGDETDQALLICFDESPEIESYSHSYVPAMLIASLFLLLTAIVYGLLWDQHTVHGWTIFSFVASMFFMYIFLVAAHILGKTRTEAEESGSVLCTAIGIAAHFFFLSAFCWMTLINVDLFWTFRVLRPDGTGKSKGIRRYALFLLCALLVPVTVIGTGILLAIEYPDIESEVIVPDYGLSTCFISRTARGPYLYYIIGSLLGCNMALIIVTFATVYYLKKSTKLAQIKSAERSGQSLKLFGKLFVIMGVTWIFELISWLVTSMDGSANGDESLETGRIPVIWIIIDLVNVLQAVAIFFIFVCKRKTWTQLQAKYPLIKKLSAYLPPFRFTSASNKSSNGIGIASGHDVHQSRARTLGALGALDSTLTAGIGRNGRRSHPGGAVRGHNPGLELNSNSGRSSASNLTAVTGTSVEDPEISTFDDPKANNSSYL